MGLIIGPMLDTALMPQNPLIGLFVVKYHIQMYLVKAFWIRFFGQISTSLAILWWLMPKKSNILDPEPIILVFGYSVIFGPHWPKWDIFTSQIQSFKSFWSKPRASFRPIGGLHSTTISAALWQRPNWWTHFREFEWASGFCIWSPKLRPI